MTFEEYLLALLIFREAAGESYLGRIAVAHVVATRARNPRWWGSSIYEVITKPYQFSSLTDPRDAQLAKFPKLSDPLFMNCVAIAKGVIIGQIPNPVPRADHYYADYIATPSWAVASEFLTQVGRHRFFAVEGVLE